MCTSVKPGAHYVNVRDKIGVEEDEEGWVSSGAFDFFFIRRISRMKKKWLR